MASKGTKRKNIARGSSSRQQQPEYDNGLFRSLGCAQFHASIDPAAKFVKEKALQLPPGQFEEMRQNISDRGWERFVAYPKPASRSLVFEFYSNACPKPAVDGNLVFPAYESFVRGRRVPYNASAINHLFGLESVPVLDCLERSKINRKNMQLDHERADEIREALCKPGADWVRNTYGDPQKLMVNSLTPAARGWAAFILATILPSSNQSELNIDRAILAYCIVRGEPVNVGAILEDEINRFAQFKRGLLPNYWRHASLVALLCERAGVVAKLDEPLVSPAAAITASWIRSRVGLEHPVHEEEHPQEQQPEQEPMFTMGDFETGPSSSDFQQLQARVDLLTANQERMMRSQDEFRFGMQNLYRAVCTISGGQLDPEADIFQPPPQ